MIKLRTLLAVAAVMIALPAHAQDQCKDILINGTHETTRVKESAVLRHVLLTRLKTASYEEAIDKSKMGFNVPDYFNGSYSRQKHESVKQTLESSVLDSLSLDTQLDYFKSGASQAIVSAWSNCMKNKGGELIAYFEILSPLEAIMHIDYAKARSPSAPLKLTLQDDIWLPDDVIVTSNSQCLKKDYKITEAGCVIGLSLPKASTTMPVAISTDEKSTTAYLPSRVSIEAQTAPYPVDADLTSFVKEGSATPNRDTPHVVELNMNSSLRKEGWVFSEDSFGLAPPERKGDGKCLTALIAQSSPRSLRMDMRVDRNPKDKELYCIFTAKAQMFRFAAVDQIRQ